MGRGQIKMGLTSDICAIGTEQFCRCLCSDQPVASYVLFGDSLPRSFGVSGMAVAEKVGAGWLCMARILNYN